MTERVVEALEVVEVDEEDGEWPPVPTAAAVERPPDSIPEQGPVGEARQAVMERLVPDGVVEAGVLESHGGLAGEHLRHLDVARTERARTVRRHLQSPDRRPGRDERDDHHALLLDRGEVGDLVGVRLGVRRINDGRARLLQDETCCGIVGEGIRRLECIAPLGREVAEGDDPVRRLIPVAEGAVAGADRLADVPGDAVADELRVHGPGEIVGHGHDAAQVVGRRLHPAAHFPQEDEQEYVGQDERQEGDPLGDLGRQPIANREDLRGDDRPDPDETGNKQGPTDIAAGEERQDKDGRQERGNGHRRGERRLDDRGCREEPERQRRHPPNDAFSTDVFDGGGQVRHQSGVPEGGQAEPDGPWFAVSESGQELKERDPGRGYRDGSEHRAQLTCAPIDPDRHGGDELLAEVDSRDGHVR